MTNEKLIKKIDELILKLDEYIYFERRKYWKDVYEKARINDRDF